MISTNKLKQVLEKWADGLNPLEWKIDLIPLQGKESLVLYVHWFPTSGGIIPYNQFVFELEEGFSSGSFEYIQDLNCKWKEVQFRNLKELKEQLDNLLTDPESFGKAFKGLQTVFIHPLEEINKKIPWGFEEKFWAFDYEPETLVPPCSSLNFLFKIESENNKYSFRISLRKGAWELVLKQGKKKTLALFALASDSITSRC